MKVLTWIYNHGIQWLRSRAGFIKKELTVEGRKIVYLESRKRGNTDPIVLIHGFGAEKDNWLELSKKLESKYRIIAIDLPGHGESFQDFDWDFRFTAQAEFLSLITKELGLGRIHLVGHSMGGAIAALVSAESTQSILTLTLINPAGIFDHRSDMDDARDRGEVNPLIISEQNDIEHLLAFATARLPAMTKRLVKIFAAVMNRDGRCRTAINERIFKAISEDYKHEDRERFKTTLTRIKAPTLIIWGKLDRVIHPGNVNVFEKLIPRSRKVLLDGIGHLPMIEDPQKVSESICEHTQHQ